MLRTGVVFVLLGLVSAASLSGHDVWVQVNSPVVRVGDLVHIDAMLGNHGNDHRDFKLASKVPAEGWTLRVTKPSRRESDLKQRLTDTGYTSKEGFWSSRFIPDEPGLHLVAQALDRLHGTSRTIKGAKAFILATPRLEPLADNGCDFTRAAGHPLEIVPLTDPVRNVHPGQPVEVQVLYRGKPHANARVSFIPRSKTLSDTFDPQYERMTDENGRASYTPQEGDWLLIVTREANLQERGKDYDRTQYTATLTLFVPEIPYR